MIWVIAGTKSARTLIAVLLDAGYHVLATTTTDYGKDLINKNERLTVFSGGLNYDEMISMIGKYRVKLIADSTHPFSLEVKRNAYKASLKCGIPYLHFERETVSIPEAIQFDTYNETAEYLECKEGNVLLTIGSKNIGNFNVKGRRNIYARVFPLASSVSACIEAGFRPENILAMQFSFSETFEAALMKEFDIKYLVTKDSGSEGGINEKINAALKCGIQVLLIKRPVTDYGEAFRNSGDIIKRAGEIING